MNFSEENLHPGTESSGPELGLPGRAEEEPAQDQDTEIHPHGPADEPLALNSLIWTNQGEEEPSLMNQGRHFQHLTQVLLPTEPLIWKKQLSFPIYVILPYLTGVFFFL